MAMTLVTALVNLRKVLRSKTQGNWSDTHLQTYLGFPALNYAYEKTIIADKSLYIATATLTGTGSELIALPADFMHLVEIKDPDTGTDYYTTYEEVDVVNRREWQEHTTSGRAYYFQGSQIALLPTLDAGDTLTLTYQRKYVAWTTSVASDLPEAGEWVAIYFAALLALSDRGDANVGTIQQLLLTHEAQLNLVRRGQRKPTHFVAHAGAARYRQVNIT